MNTICISCTRLFKTKTFNNKCRDCNSIDSSIFSLSGKLVCAKTLDGYYPKHGQIYVNYPVASWLLYTLQSYAVKPAFLNNLKTYSYLPMNNNSTIINYKFPVNSINSIHLWKKTGKYIQVFNCVDKNNNNLYNINIWNNISTGLVRDHAFYSVNEFNNFIYQPMKEYIYSIDIIKCIPKDITNIILLYLSDAVEKFHN